MVKIDRDELLEWLKKEFYTAKRENELTTDAYTRRYTDGVMSAYQNIKFAIDTGEIKVSE